MINPDPNPIVFWELTRLCDLYCRGCPSGASTQRDPNELSTYETFKTLDQIAALRPRELTLSGGDPLERDDIYEIIDYARKLGLDPSLVLSPTDALTFDAIARLQKNGLTRVVFSVDGSSAPIHESLHGVIGSWAATLRGLRWAEQAGLQVEINTLVTRWNMNDLDAIAEMLRLLPVKRWNVHFIVPIGASRDLPMITAEETEGIFAKLEEIRGRESFAVRAIEAPHYRRFRVQQHLIERLRRADARWSDFTGFVDEQDGVRELLEASLDGPRSFVYISHAGEVRPSEFAPQSAGNLRFRLLGEIYRGSDLFVALRNPDNLHGRCGVCEFRVLCGGSRARAYATSGDLFGADPLCAYEPHQTPSIAFVNHGRENSA
jgi:MoaA/NifB/PqqE/SkfB family radical SAM enzyme